jgi:translation initiation factor IF-1
LHKSQCERFCAPFGWPVDPSKQLSRAFQPGGGDNPANSFAKAKPTMPVQDDVITIEGKITSVLAGTMFRVELANKHLVLGHISGKMRKRFIRLAMGDRVKMEMSPYDLTKARIVYRLG